MSSFAADVRRFTVKTQGKLTAVVRKIALDAFSEVILLSPVDTGRFVGNWQVAIGNVPTGTLDLTDPSRSAAISAVTATTMGLKAGDVIHIVNNLPYGPRLEDGWSQKAPAGMVRLTAQRFQAIVDAATRAVADK